MNRSLIVLNDDSDFNEIFSKLDLCIHSRSRGFCISYIRLMHASQSRQVALSKVQCLQIALVHKDCSPCTYLGFFLEPLRVIIQKDVSKRSNFLIL